MAIHFDIGRKPQLCFEVSDVKVGGGKGNVSSAQIDTIIALDRAEYDALEIKDSRTLYLIRG
jgi:hypothetical protein